MKEKMITGCLILWKLTVWHRYILTDLPRSLQAYFSLSFWLNISYTWLSLLPTILIASRLWGGERLGYLLGVPWLQTGSPKRIYHTESKRQLQLRCPTNRIPLSLNNKLEGRTFKHWSTIFKGLIQHMTDHQQKVHYKAQDFWHSLKPKGSQKVRITPPRGKAMKSNTTKAQLNT